MKSSKKLSKAELKSSLLSRAVDQVISRSDLQKALNSNKKLRIKLGIDPTSPDLHLGHAVVLRKLRDFQNLGHKIVFIIGDFTARVGDPSGRSKERPLLTEKEINTNMSDYLKQAGKIIDIKRAEIRHNSEWLGKDVGEILGLAKAGTINQLSERADFRERMKKGQKVTLLEAFYSLLQGFDSVKIKADVELGGKDQLLNLLMGRQVQRYFKMKEQNILTVPLLEGTDGIKKMSKSEGNYIALNSSPEEMFGKIMSIKDALIARYFELCTDTTQKDLKAIKLALSKKTTNPMEYKLRLAREIVTSYHNSLSAKRAEEEFLGVFSKKELPKRVSSKTLSRKTLTIVDLIFEADLASSKSEARRLITQGGVKIDGQKITNPEEKIALTTKEKLLQVGKRHFLKIKSR